MIGTVMTIVFIVGTISFLVSVISLISESKRKKLERRKLNRQHMNDNTVRTMLRFEKKREPYSLRKSS